MGAVNEFVKIVQATFDLEVFIFENLAVLKSPISQSLNVACAGINKSTVSIMLQFLLRNPEGSLNAVFWRVIIIDYAQPAWR